MNLKLGKHPYKHDDRTLRLAKFLNTAQLPTPPSELSFVDKVHPWPMYGNDQLGDCTIAAAGHLIELWSRLDKHPTDPTLKTVESVYHKLSPNDEGCVMLDVLNYWRKTGIGTHHILSFAALDLKNINHIELAVNIFGGAYIGIALPISAQSQVGKVWDVPTGGLHGNGAKGSWGGHAVNVVGYNAVGPVVITWGAPQQMTWAFWAAYCDEAWVILTKDWVSKGTVNGFDFATLQADLAQIATVHN